jgi:hypothetical protein
MEYRKELSDEALATLVKQLDVAQSRALMLAWLKEETQRFWVDDLRCACLVRMIVNGYKPASTSPAYYAVYKEMSHMVKMAYLNKLHEPVCKLINQPAKIEYKKLMSEANALRVLAQELKQTKVYSEEEIALVPHSVCYEMWELDREPGPTEAEVRERRLKWIFANPGGYEALLRSKAHREEQEAAKRSQRERLEVNGVKPASQSWIAQAEADERAQAARPSWAEAEGEE